VSAARNSPWSGAAAVAMSAADDARSVTLATSFAPVDEIWSLGVAATLKLPGPVLLPVTDTAASPSPEPTRPAQTKGRLSPVALNIKSEATAEGITRAFAKREQTIESNMNKIGSLMKLSRGTFYKKGLQLTRSTAAMAAKHKPRSAAE